MFTFNNTHIFTGYLKQLLATFPLPNCRVYTKEFVKYRIKHGKEDPRVVESIRGINTNRPAMQVNYLKDSGIYRYRIDAKSTEEQIAAIPHWERSTTNGFEPNRHILGLTKTLYSPTGLYDTKTHEYLGDYLRFLRDFYDLNLMSLYNCFSNKIYSNVDCKLEATSIYPKIEFNSYDPKYRIYALPVKLFQDYTIAIDCAHGIEVFCGFYKTTLDWHSDRGRNLIQRTYEKISRTAFSQPELYTKLNVNNWLREDELIKDTVSIAGEQQEIMRLVNNELVSRLDVINREQDLKLFIKIPTTCRSSITILEGDYRGYNDSKYEPVPVVTSDTKTTYYWQYSRNSWVNNFQPTKNDTTIQEAPFKPVSKLQLLAFNTGESYPFADRLIEYLAGSAITQIDDISDNIARAQNVMEQNGHYFNIKGIWNDKMRKIAYDYMINSGPFELENTTNGVNTAVKIIDTRQGRHPKLGYSSKSTVYDILGYIDKDVEKAYSRIALADGKLKVADNIQDTDIYNNLYKDK